MEEVGASGVARLKGLLPYSEYSVEVMALLPYNGATRATKITFATPSGAPDLKPSEAVATAYKQLIIFRYATPPACA